MLLIAQALRVLLLENFPGFLRLACQPDQFSSPTRMPDFSCKFLQPPRRIETGPLLEFQKEKTSDLRRAGADKFRGLISFFVRFHQFRSAGVGCFGPSAGLPELAEISLRHGPLIVQLRELRPFCGLLSRRHLAFVVLTTSCKTKVRALLASSGQRFKP